MLYKMPPYRSSKIFATRVFWRLRNQTLDGHISGLVHHRDKLKPLLPTTLPTPYRLAPVPFMSRDHTTSGLAFLARRSSKTVDKAATARDNRGYICLCLSGDHFDVLQGVDGVAPTIPQQAEPQVLSAERMAWQPVEVNSGRYSSPFVWKWSSGEMHNVTVADTSSDTQRLYAAVLKSVSPQPLPQRVTRSRSAKLQEKKQVSPGLPCGVAGHQPPEHDPHFQPNRDDCAGAYFYKMPRHIWNWVT